ncbi:hypothetical protein C8J56DRAFT_903395 [Mycena floridula]|nr:hypothetical protein C8J56DRAFT_903395 [Mycena floridula]
MYLPCTTTQTAYLEQTKTCPILYVTDLKGYEHDSEKQHLLGSRYRKNLAEVFLYGNSANPKDWMRSEITQDLERFTRLYRRSLMSRRGWSEQVTIRTNGAHNADRQNYLDRATSTRLKRRIGV